MKLNKNLIYSCVIAFSIYNLIGSWNDLIFSRIVIICYNIGLLVALAYILWNKESR